MNGQLMKAINVKACLKGNLLNLKDRKTYKNIKLKITSLQALRESQIDGI